MADGRRRAAGLVVGLALSLWRAAPAAERQCEPAWPPEAMVATADLGAPAARLVVFQGACFWTYRLWAEGERWTARLTDRAGRPLTEFLQPPPEPDGDQATTWDRVDAALRFNGELYVFRGRRFQRLALTDAGRVLVDKVRTTWWFANNWKDGNTQEVRWQVAPAVAHLGDGTAAFFAPGALQRYWIEGGPDASPKLRDYRKRHKDPRKNHLTPRKNHLIPIKRVLADGPDRVVSVAAHLGQGRVLTVGPDGAAHLYAKRHGQGMADPQVGLDDGLPLDRVGEQAAVTTVPGLALPVILEGTLSRPAAPPSRDPTPRKENPSERGKPGQTGGPDAGAAARASWPPTAAALIPTAPGAEGPSRGRLITFGGRAYRAHDVWRVDETLSIRPSRRAAAGSSEFLRRRLGAGKAHADAWPRVDAAVFFNDTLYLFRRSRKGVYQRYRPEIGKARLEGRAGPVHNFGSDGHNVLWAKLGGAVGLGDGSVLFFSAGGASRYWIKGGRDGVEGCGTATFLAVGLTSAALSGWRDGAISAAARLGRGVIAVVGESRIHLYATPDPSAEDGSCRTRGLPLSPIGELERSQAQGAPWPALLQGQVNPPATGGTPAHPSSGARDPKPGFTP